VNPERLRAECIDHAEALRAALRGSREDWATACRRFDAFVLKLWTVRLGLAIEAFLKRRARVVPPGQEQAA